jgi:ElaB/YqjD/DUF883 family membrane-anchored ribosome-binding protein
MVSGNKRDSLQQDFQAVKDDLRKLKTDTGSVAKGVYDASCCSAMEAKTALQDTLKAAASKGQVGLDVARDQISTRPATAMAIAFGAGLIAGLFLLGRRA